MPTTTNKQIHGTITTGIKNFFFIDIFPLKDENLNEPVSLVKILHW